MLTAEIFETVRKDYLHDAVPPYGWEDDELIRYLNRAINNWCRTTGGIRDIETTAICRIQVLANKHTYAMDSRILEIHSPSHIINYITSAGTYSDRQIEVKNDTWIDANISGWRTATGDVNYLMPNYGSKSIRVVRYPGTDQGYFTGAFTFTAATKKVTQATTKFGDYLADGDQVVVSGTVSNGTTAIPATFTVATATTGSFTVDEAVVGEVLASGGIIQKITDTVWLTVSRLPLTALTVGGMETESPEIESRYHEDLIDGILSYAYMKQDSQCYDKQKGMDHRLLFQDSMMRAKHEVLVTREGTDITARPPAGAL